MSQTTPHVIVLVDVLPLGSLARLHSFGFNRPAAGWARLSLLVLLSTPPGSEACAPASVSPWSCSSLSDWCYRLTVLHWIWLGSVLCLLCACWAILELQGHSLNRVGASLAMLDFAGHALLLRSVVLFCGVVSRGEEPPKYDYSKDCIP